MKKQNTWWFSIIVAILLVVVMTLLVLYILEYMIPYSKNIKWIENSSNAFYQAESWVEDTLFEIKNRAEITDESTKSFWTTAVDYNYSTVSSGDIIPPVWEWNSWFDKNYNTISADNPIQLEVWWLSSSDWNNIGFTFRTPLISNSRGNLDPSNIAIINWQLSWNGDTLNAESSWILTNDFTSGILISELFDGSEANAASINYDDWQILDWTLNDFQTFYANNCLWINNCILKMSVINELKTATESIPYLEYKINFNSNNVPLRFSRIDAQWKSYGFQKSLEVRVPQQTTNEAFDFTVFQ